MHTSEALVARQPIFDQRLEVVAYELLFRSGAVERADIVDEEGATATVLLNSLTDIGIERLVGNRSAWINASSAFLLGGYASLLPAQLFVIELAADQEMGDDLRSTVAELSQRGYRIALDDFVYSESLEPILELVSFVKLDLRACGRDEVARTVRRLRGRNVEIIAEKLETYDDHRFCMQLGCDLFQGYFYCRPQTVRPERADADRLAVLKLLATLQDPTLDLHHFERAVAGDPRLSYRLLRYMNSAFFGFSREIRSIRQAIVLLGVENLKRWATLSLFTMVDEKPAELTRTALTRARFCELSSEELGGLSRGELFTVGLLSVIDALLDLPIDQVLRQVSLAAEISQALRDHAGIYGQALECVIALETGDAAVAEGLIPDAEDLYMDSLVWADEAAGALSTV